MLYVDALTMCECGHFIVKFNSLNSNEKLCKSIRVFTKSGKHEKLQNKLNFLKNLKYFIGRGIFYSIEKLAVHLFFCELI